MAEQKPRPNYEIMHTLVGPWPKGRVVSDQELRSHPGMDNKAIDRLMNLRPPAIKVVKDTPPTAEPLEPGPFTDLKPENATAANTPPAPATTNVTPSPESGAPENATRTVEGQPAVAVQPPKGR